MAITTLGCSNAGDGATHHGGAAASVSTRSEAGPYAGREIAEPRARPSFVLTDQDGTAFNFGEKTAGLPTLLFFGYANCPDVCPTTMADVALALRASPADVTARTQVVFVTTDPARDTPAFLAEYLSRFDKGLPNRFIGLTGTQADVQAAQELAGVPVAEDGGTMHATSVFLYGPDNVARVMFSAGDSAAAIAADLEKVASA